MNSTPTDLPGGTWTLGDRTVSRFGYGAMQLAGPWVMGPPKDHDAAIAVLRASVANGVTHIDTAETYGPRVVNDLIREALHPYADELFIATKAGGRRDADGGWPAARRPDELRAQIDDNLDQLGVDTLDLVHLRLGDADGPVAEDVTDAMETLVDLQQQGLIRHLGVSNATADQVAQARSIAPIVSVQNM
jgi:aryl-alcohol dehydrogenase-like predicted oxidoreductase